MKTIYIVLQLTEKGAELKEITRTNTRLEKYLGNPHYLIFRYYYKGRYIIVDAEGTRGVPLKSLVIQKLAMHNSWAKKMEEQYTPKSIWADSPLKVVQPKSPLDVPNVRETLKKLQEGITKAFENNQITMGLIERMRNETIYKLNAVFGDYSFDVKVTQNEHNPNMVDVEPANLVTALALAGRPDLINKVPRIQHTSTEYEDSNIEYRNGKIRFKQPLQHISVDLAVGEDHTTIVEVRKDESNK